MSIFVCKKDTDVKRYRVAGVALHKLLMESLLIWSISVFVRLKYHEFNVHQTQSFTRNVEMFCTLLVANKYGHLRRQTRPLT